MSFFAIVLFLSFITLEITANLLYLFIDNIRGYIFLHRLLILPVLLFTITYSTHQTGRVFGSYKLILLLIYYILYKTSQPYTRVNSTTHNQLFYITITLIDYYLSITWWNLIVKGKVGESLEIFKGP